MHTLTQIRQINEVAIETNIIIILIQFYRHQEWELSLSDKDDEMEILKELGLGVAVDITRKHPWVTKSAFQAKPVIKEELVVINESNRSQRSREQVETYNSIQQGLESSFRPDPTTPISVTVAADFHRSNSRSKTINSQTILTRTVTFRAKDPLQKSRDDRKGKESFENNLHQWLVKRNCYPGGVAKGVGWGDTLRVLNHTRSNQVPRDTKFYTFYLTFIIFRGDRPHLCLRYNQVQSIQESVSV